MPCHKLAPSLVPINFRLNPREIEYIIQHSGASILCAHADYLEMSDTIRDECPNVRHFVALEGARDGWLSYSELLEAESGDFEAEPVDERDLLTINYTSGTTSQPKGVMITHRNAYMNVVGTLIHLPMTCEDRYLWTFADVPCKRMDVRLDRDGCWWNPCLPPQGRPG